MEPANLQTDPADLRTDLVAEREPAGLGAGSLATPHVIRHQRLRILRAIAEEVVASGYRGTTIAAIVKRAGVARASFYDSFANKEECFLAACELAGEEAMRRVEGAVREAPPSWARRVRDGIGAFLSFATAEPALVRIFVLEAPAAGPAAAGLYERTVRAVVPMFRLGRRCSSARQLPPTLEETVVGGIVWIVYQRLALGRPEELERLMGELVEFALTPYLGAEAARRVAEE
jgi:AcrR family transcriptional regulator